VQKLTQRISKDKDDQVNLPMPQITVYQLHATLTLHPIITDKKIIPKVDRIHRELNHLRQLAFSMVYFLLIYTIVHHS